MSVTGTWNLTLNSPLGDQAARLDLHDTSGALDGTLTGKGSARRAPAVLASSTARPTATAEPAMTTCPGALKLTASTTSPAAASSHTACT